MSELLRGVAAGYGTKRAGGGCISAVHGLEIPWWLPGHFGYFR